MPRLTRLLAPVALAAALGACNTPMQRLATHADALADAREVAAAFYAAYGQQVGLRDVPFVTLGVESGSGYAYEPDHNVLFVTPYRDADFDTQRYFARACERDRAEPVYDSLMFRFFTAHELMHLAYDKLPVRGDLTDFEVETRVNVLTWLFLRQADLLPAGGPEQEAALAGLVDELADRFPAVRRGEETAATLLIDDNASYWFVTATSILEARGVARAAGTPTDYAAHLSRADAAALAPAEAKL